jgi:hypothetical protein
MTWDSFLSAEIGATAALTGLIFVGISINLQRLLQLPNVANRALQALLILLGLLGVESLLLVPNQSEALQGTEILTVAVALLAALDWMEWRSWKIPSQWRVGTHRIHSIEIQVPIGFSVIGGALLVVGSPAALYWFVPAVLTGFLIAIAEAWVISVEIVR